MSKLHDLKKYWLKNPLVKAEYEALAKDLSVAEAPNRTCANANMIQDRVEEE